VTGIENRDGHVPGILKYDPAGDNLSNSRNGYTPKTVLTSRRRSSGYFGNGTFKPQIILKYQKRLPLFNDQINSMYAFGMTDRDSKRTLMRYRLN
jgi:transposase-like protein